MMRTLLLLAAGVSADRKKLKQIATELDVPRGRAQTVIVQSRDFAAGAESGWHIHPGTEVAYITSGQLEVRVKGKVTVLNAGDSVTIPRGLAHNGVNRGPQTAKVVITLVVEKGAALRRSVSAP